MPERVKHMSDLVFILGSGAFAMIGGAISYLLKWCEGHKFSWAEFFIHSITSGFFGIIAYECFAFEGLHPYFSGAMAGMTGYYGTRICRIFEVVVLKRKLGVDPKDIQTLSTCPCEKAGNGDCHGSKKAD